MLHTKSHSRMATRSSPPTATRRSHIMPLGHTADLLKEFKGQDITPPMMPRITPETLVASWAILLC